MLNKFNFLLLKSISSDLLPGKSYEYTAVQKRAPKSYIARSQNVLYEEKSAKLDVEWIDVGNGLQLPKEQEITKYTTY